MSDWTPEAKDELIAQYVTEIEKFPEAERGEPQCGNGEELIRAI